MNEFIGPFKTVQPIQILDFELDQDSEISFEIPKELETNVLFVYSGSGNCLDQNVTKWDVLLLKESNHRNLVLSSKLGLKAILFSGSPIREPITWLGPFVQGSEADMQRLISNYQSGRFPPVQVKNYKG